MNDVMSNAADRTQDFMGLLVLRPEQQRMLRIGALAAAVVAAFLSIELLATGQGGHPSAPQHDTLMFMQYARALACGHPYEYQLGDSPSTGSTSHLYPALLAVFYVAGLRGENLYYASLFINVAFYVSAIVLTGLLAAAILPHLMWLAMALTILSGPVLLGAFGQTDMGLFMVCALGVWVALLYGRHLAAFAALTAAVWTRPEGALVAFAVTLSGLFFLRRSRRAAVWAFVGLCGLLQFGAVLLWNRWLTGTLTFHSVLGKGYWVFHPWMGAVKRTAREAAHLVLWLLMGWPTAQYQFRLLYGWPILSGLLLAAGWLRALRDEKGARRAFSIGVFTVLSGAVLVTAAGGWQGYFYDRHLAWIFPFTTILISGGANWFYEHRLRSPRTTRAPLLTLLLTGYAALMFPVFVGNLRMSALTTGSQAHFAQQTVPQIVPDGGRIGILNFPGLAYVLPNHTLVHLGGYISPRFAAPADFIAAIETLKHEPEKRFAYWLLSRIEQRHPTLKSVIGPSLAMETDVFPDSMRLGLLRADFSALDRGMEPRLFL
jgi:hypothetical protein